MITKKTFGKRILSLALVFLLVLSLIPASVMAVDTDKPWLDSSVTATKDGITLYIPEVYCDNCGENVQDAELVIDSVDYVVGILRVKYHFGYHPCFEIYTKSNTISIDDFDCTTEYNEYPVYANAWDQTTTEPVAYLSREAGHIFDEGESGICTFCGEMVQTGWVYDSGNWYYYYEDGTMATNVVISNENGSYYFGSDGALVVNQMVQVDGVWYQAAEDGRLEPLETDTHNYVNGICSDCGEYQPATDENNDGIYEIGNAGQLYWFAQYVNAGNTSANAILTDNIVVNEGVITLESTDARPWTPIGNYNNKYTGTFNGNNHTVSGLYFNNSEAQYVGLFGYIGENSEVKNTGVINSYINGNSSVGGVVGYNNVGTMTNCYNTGSSILGVDYVGGVVGFNKGTITNCYNASDVSGEYSAGGFVGRNIGSIANCYNTGNVTGDNVGGIVYDNYGTITNCYNSGKINGSVDTQNGIACFGNESNRRHGTFTQCYYIGDSDDDSIDGTTAMNTEQFKNGEVAYLLGDAFGQKIGTDTYPVLSGDKVYYVTNCKSENIYSNTNENDQHNVVDDSCTNCGLSSSTVMEIKLLKLAIKRANEIADENNVLESKKEPLDDIYQDLLAVGKQEESSQLSRLAMVKIELTAYNNKLQAGIADGTWVKADYTEIDAAVAEIESSGATTDKMSAKLDEIKSELSVMKESSETSKADVDVLMKEVETLKDCVSGNHIFENGKCTICGAEEYVDQLAGYSLSLGDKIAVNYYMSLTEKTLNDANAKMVFTVPDTGSTYTVEIPVSEAVKSGDYYVFTCEVAAKEMTSVIEAKLVTSESELQLDEYTVQEYAEVILSDTVKYAKEQKLVKAMLNYGAEAQLYFDYNTDNLANDTELMTEEEKTVELYGFAGAPYTITGEEAGVTYYGTALSLETELMFKHYFIIDESVDIDSLEITCDYPVTLKKNGSFYELIISDIPAHKMGEGSLKVSLGGMTLDYTIYSYGALVQNSGNEELWTVVSALAHFAGEATMYAYK